MVLFLVFAIKGTFFLIWRYLMAVRASNWTWWVCHVNRSNLAGDWNISRFYTSTYYRHWMITESKRNQSFKGGWVGMILPLFCISVYSDLLFENIYCILGTDSLLKEWIEHRFTSILNWRTLVTIDQGIYWFCKILMQALIGHMLSA